MEDHYIIGIYGTKNSTFQLGVTSQEEKISQISEGLAIKHAQKPYDIAYFQYYHFTPSDILLQLTVSSGTVDIYVSTFNASGSTQFAAENFLDRIPKNKEDAMWVVEDITSINTDEAKDLLIMQLDRFYCTDCTYLIGVVTHDQRA